MHAIRPTPSPLALLALGVLLALALALALGELAPLELSLGDDGPVSAGAVPTGAPVDAGWLEDPLASPLEGLRTPPR